MATYNGHKNWAYWNVSLWIGNDEGLYRYARGLKRRYGAVRAAEIMAEELEGQNTPDGAKYTRNNIRAALRGL